jgi:DNA-binding GntR family transcriptional regulator
VPRQVRYRAIAQDVASRIESGELSPGQRLPTEPELAERFGVHRLTARQAMVELRKAGLVDTQHGRGSFVRSSPQRLEASIDPVTRRHRPEDAEGAAAGPDRSEEILERGLARHPAAAGHLGLDREEVYEIVTLIKAGPRPCTLNRFHLDPALADLEVDPEHGVLAALEARGATYRYVWHVVSAEMATPADHALLAAEAGTAILVREGLVAHRDRPVCHIDRRCRGDLVAFVTRYDSASGTSAS